MKSADLTQEILELRPVLRQFTHRFTRDRDESLDLVQETVLKALTFKHRFTEQTNLKGWLFTIMRNTFINHYRKAKRMNISRNADGSNYHLEVSDPVHSPESYVRYLELRNVVEQIREELRTPFKMYTSGYKYNEIADHLNIPMGTVKNRIFQARKELQKYMAV